MKNGNGLRNNRILVIDDNPAIHEDIREILGRQGEPKAELAKTKALVFEESFPVSPRTDFEIVSAFQGEEGLRKVQEASAAGRPYAMAFIDVRMPPGWDGVETINRIWKDHPDLQIVICTAYSDYSWEEMIRHIGKSDNLLILKKPFDNIEVLQLAHALTQKWALSHEVNYLLNHLEQLVSQRTTELQAANEELKAEIADRMRTEKALRLSEGALKQSEERLHEVMRSTRCILNSGELEAPEGWRERVTNEPQLFRWNFPVLNVEAAQEVFPLDVPSDKTYQEVWSESRYPDDFRQMHLVARDAFLHDKPFYRNEFRCTDKHGVEHWMQEFITIHKLGENRWQIFGINTDITDLKKSEGALRTSEGKLREFTTQLERSNRELQNIVYVASHDLQEPLRKIVVFGERLKEQGEGKLDAEACDYLERMQKAASRMQTLINDLLTFSRVTTKARPFVQVDLAQVAREVVNDLEGRLEQVKGRVEVGTLPLIDAEALQMRQLLQNLIGNAIKFRRPEASPVVKVEARIISGPSPEAGTGVVRKFCQLTVSDNGIGFDEKYLDRIFNVFQRLHSRNEYEGSGMGLAVARKIALFHHGEITAQSKPGKGATFIGCRC